jgi:hypothetical protein
MSRLLSSGTRGGDSVIADGVMRTVPRTETSVPGSVDATVNVVAPSVAVHDQDVISPDARVPVSMVVVICPLRFQPLWTFG